MIKNNCYSLIVLLISLMSYDRNKTKCQMSNLYELQLAPIQAKLMIPHYKIVDSTLYDPKTVLSYDIHSYDKTFEIKCFIKSGESQSPSASELNSVMSFQKGEVEFGRDSIRKIDEKFRTVDGVRVGFVKYFVRQQKESFWESRIFFFKETKLVTLWVFEKYQTTPITAPLLSDCILQNIIMK